MLTNKQTRSHLIGSRKLVGMVWRQIKLLVLKMKYILEMWKRNNICKYLKCVHLKYVRSILYLYILFYLKILWLLYFYHKQTEEEDMRTTRNQAYIALLQRSKESKEYVIYKNMNCIFIRKNKHNLQIHRGFRYVSKYIFALWNAVRHSRQKPQCEN